MFKFYYIIILIILFIGLFLRIYKLNEIPPGLHRDEASVGYNAYLLSQTFVDEHGKFLPLVFEAFGDWKRPINIYLSALLIPFMGVSVLTVRLPVALLGTLTILLVYLNIYEFSKNRGLSLLSAFVLSVSPWHIYMSRNGLGWNTVGVCLFLTALYFLLKARENRYYSVLSGTFFGFTLFSYASNQFITPLFILFLALWFIVTKRNIKYGWSFIVPFSIFFITFLIIYISVISENSVGSSFFSSDFKYNSLEVPYGEHQNIFTARIFHNKYVGWVEQYARNYLQIFSPQFFLYNTADNPSYSLKNSGNIYIFEVIFLCIGLYFYFRKKMPYSEFLLFLLFVTPIPAAFTLNSLSSTRTLFFAPIVSLLIGVGIYEIYYHVKNKHSQIAYLFVFFICISYVVSFAKFSDEYLVHFPINRVEHWGVAQKELVDYLSAVTHPYDEILISRPNETFYIYLMFYSFFDKVSYDQIVRYPKSNDGFVYAKEIGKYKFRDIRYIDDLTLPNRLIVDKTINMESLATPSAYFAGYNERNEPVYTKVTVEETIRLPDGRPVYSILSTSDYKTRNELDNNYRTKI
jgi:hypothetical protein